MHCLPNRFIIAGRNFIARSKKIMWSTSRASDGLRVKASIRGVLVLRSAVIVQQPISHRDCALGRGKCHLLLGPCTLAMNLPKRANRWGHKSV